MSSFRFLNLPAILAKTFLSSLPQRQRIIVVFVAVYCTYGIDLNVDN